ncbi:hypothetical protein AAFF_G00189610, partial [Aldrovandia affinis]
LFTDLTNVGIVYELAQRLGVHELVHTCQATFPNLRGLGPAPESSFLARPLLERHMVLHAEDGGGLGPQGNGAPALAALLPCARMSSTSPPASSSISASTPLFTDLTNVGIVYELAQRLGVHELVHTCQATFPNLRGSGSSPGEQVVDLDLDLGFTTPAQQLSGKSLPKEFQAVRVHLLAHACLQPQPSLGARCACSFLARPLLERHMVLHAEDGGGLGPQGNGAPALLRCSLCPHVFHFASSFQLHLSQHASKPFQCKLFTDLTNVGVVYELAQRLGVHELVHTCQATFPNLRGLVPARRAGCKGSPSGPRVPAAPALSGARCACSFLARPLLERHMVLHAEDGGGLGAPGQWCPRALLRCSLCPHVFHFASSFQLHLSQHASKPFQCKLFTDLTNVGIVYELAQRLGVHELVHTCQATFPNLRGSGSSPGEQVVDLDLDLGFTTPAQQLSGKSLPKEFQ